MREIRGFRPYTYFIIPGPFVVICLKNGNIGIESTNFVNNFIFQIHESQFFQAHIYDKNRLGLHIHSQLVQVAKIVPLQYRYITLKYLNRNDSVKNTYVFRNSFSMLLLPINF